MVGYNTDELTSRPLSSSKLLLRAWAARLASFRLFTTLFAWDWAFTVEAAREARRATELMNFMVLVVLLCKI